jgi:uncharacterized membrane protein
MRRERMSDEEVEQWIGRLLQLGVVISAAVAIIGGVVYLFRYGTGPTHYARFRGVPAGLESVHGIVEGALALRSRWVIQLGLLLLIATPILRVALALVAFLRQRDYTYVLVTSLVLALLLYSLLVSGSG